MRTAGQRSRLPAAVVVGVCLILLAGCGVAPPRFTTEGQLERRAENLPGVIDVFAGQVEGDDAVPFEFVPMDLVVVMKATSKPEDVVAVVDAYRRDSVNGTLSTFWVAIQGIQRPKEEPYPVKVASAGGRVSLTLAKDVLAAAADPGVLTYELGVNGMPDTGPGLTVSLAGSKTFDDLIAFIKRKVHDLDAEWVRVSAGKFVIHWPPPFWGWLDFAEALNREVPLTGARITDEEGALVLFVAESDRAAAFEYLRIHDKSGLTPIAISPYTPESRGTTSPSL